MAVNSPSALTDGAHTHNKTKVTKQLSNQNRKWINHSDCRYSAQGWRLMDTFLSPKIPHPNNALWVTKNLEHLKAPSKCMCPTRSYSLHKLSLLDHLQALSNPIPSFSKVVNFLTHPSLMRSREVDSTILHTSKRIITPKNWNHLQRTLTKGHYQSYHSRTGKFKFVEDEKGFAPQQSPTAKYYFLHVMKRKRFGQNIWT